MRYTNIEVRSNNEGKKELTLPNGLVFSQITCNDCILYYASKTETLNFKNSKRSEYNDFMVSDEIYNDSCKEMNNILSDKTSDNYFAKRVFNSLVKG